MNSNLSSNPNSIAYYNETFTLIHNNLDSQPTKAKELLSNLHFADIADLIDSSNVEQRKKIVSLLSLNFPPEVIASIIIELDQVVREQVIITLGDHNGVVFKAMNIDDAIFALESLDKYKQNQIINLLPENQAQSIKEGLSYPKGSAGRIMKHNLVYVNSSFTVGQAIEYLRNHQSIPLDFYEIFIVDELIRPIGTILISRLIRSNEGDSVSFLMKKDLKVILPSLDQEEVGYLFRQYALASMPVVNDDGKLIGMITFEDIVDVIEEEAEEDIMLMAGVNEIDLHAAFIDTAKHRFPWLFINLLTACLTSLVINLFHDTIHQIVSLAAIMPIVASMGGNAGTQTLTVIIRSLANRSLNFAIAKRVIVKEIITNCLNGFILSICGGFVLYLINHEVYLSLIFIIAVTVNFAMAGLLGAMIPLVLTKYKIDPATASGVFLTALTDIIGFFTFLGLAKWLLLSIT